MADKFFYETRLAFPLSTNLANAAAPWAAVQPPVVVYGTGNQISAVKSKWGTASLRMNGGTRNTSYVSVEVNAHDHFKIRTAEAWAIEAQVNFDSAGTREQPVFGGYGGGGNQNFGLFLSATGRLTYMEDGAARITQAAATIVADQWYHVELSMVGPQVYLFLDGALIGSWLWTGSNVEFRMTMFYLGSYGLSSNFNNLAGYLQDVRVTNSAGRHSEAFTPPTSPIDVSTAPVPLMKQRREQAYKLAGAATPSVGLKALGMPRPLFDTIYGGRGRVAGTVKEKGTPINTPLRRRVRLLRERDGHFIREAWSDPVTGAYSFDHIDERVAYTVLTFDHERNHRAVVADNITPGLMP